MFRRRCWEIDGNKRGSRCRSESKVRHGENSCTERQIRRQTRLRYSWLHPRATLSTPVLDLALIPLPFYRGCRSSISVFPTRTLNCKYPPSLREGGHEKLSNPRDSVLERVFILVSDAGSKLFLKHGFKHQHG